MIPIAKPLIGQEEKEAALKVLDSGVLIQGPCVEEFERKFAEYVGAANAIACVNGTVALKMALEVHGVGEHRAVITTPFSFMATASQVSACRSDLIFCDIDPKTFNICPKEVRKALKSKSWMQPAVILPVHLYGHPADLDELQSIAKEFDIAIVEDACQAHGAVYKNDPVGSRNTACWSFYPTKNMTTGAEGGMVTTNNDQVAGQLRLLRAHGQAKRYLHTHLGSNYRMSEFQAAIGIVQLKKLASFNVVRQRNAKLLSEGLKDIPGIVVPYTAPGCEHVFHQYTVRVTKDFPLTRNQLAEHLNNKGIGTGVHYPVPIHIQPVYLKQFQYDHFPFAEAAAEEVLSLPVHPSVSQSDVEYIVETIQSILVKK